MNLHPSVTVAVPVLNESSHIDACLDAIAAQTYGNVVEVLVVDGGSTDDTRERVARHPGVRLLDNPARIQAAALNLALAEAKGDVFVRVDGHTVIDADYVEQCVDALALTGAALVGGPMSPVATGWRQRGIAAAMASRFGAGPARFHVGGGAGWVDTVYLGAFPTDIGRRAGGYDPDMVANEDAELAVRLRTAGGVWFDPKIRSAYTPRASVQAVARQFYKYGRYRAVTVRKHGTIAPRQLVAPLLVLGLLSPWRRRVAVAYLACLGLAAAQQASKDAAALPGMVITLPAMHLPWGVGFIVGLFARR